MSKTTDASVRGFLARHGLGQGDLSAFIEDAVKRRMLDQTIAETRTRFADMPPGELQAMIDKAVLAARAETSHNAD